MTGNLITAEQAFSEFEEFKRATFKPGEVVFYDGPMDPLYRLSVQLQRELDAEIAAAGGLDAWRAQGTPQPKAA